MAILVQKMSNESVLCIKVDSRLNYQMVCNARQEVAALTANGTAPAYCITELSMGNASLTETLETVKLLTRNLVGKCNASMKCYFVGQDRLANFVSSIINHFVPGECPVYTTMADALTDIHAHEPMML